MLLFGGGGGGGGGKSVHTVQSCKPTSLDVACDGLTGLQPVQATGESPD